MTDTLLRLAISGAIITLLLGVVTQLPDASPLPDTLRTGVSWFLAQMYFFNDILDVPAFYDILYKALFAFAVYMSLIFVRAVIAFITVIL